MTCAYCGASVGLLRQFRDRTYCSDKHRRMMAARSSRAAREDTRFYDWDEPWAPLGVIPVQRQDPTVAFGSFTTIAIAILFVLLLAAGLTGNLPGLPSPPPFKKVAELNAAPRTISSWTALPVPGGMLRLWPESASYRNYRFGFVAVLDGNPLGWAVRVADARNYVAMRLMRSGDGYRFRRSAVIGGVEGQKTSSGLIPGIKANTPVAVSIESREDLVITQLNGKVVDSWSDPRLPSGGAGLLSAETQVPNVGSMHLAVLDRRSPSEVGYWYLPGTFLAPATR